MTKDCEHSKEDCYGYGYYLCFNPDYDTHTVCPYDRREDCEIINQSMGLKQ